MEWNGVAIRGFRKCARLTQAELAGQCGVSQGHVANVEAGRDRLNDDTARLVALALGLEDMRAIQCNPTLGPGAAKLDPRDA